MVEKITDIRATFKISTHSGYDFDNKKAMHQMLNMFITDLDEKVNCPEVTGARGVIVGCAFSQVFVDISLTELKHSGEYATQSLGRGALIVKPLEKQE